MTDSKLNSREIKEWNWLDTPQIANSEEVQQAKNLDGEEEKTRDERLASIKENNDKIRQEIQDEAEQASYTMHDLKHEVGLIKNTIK